jgi:hypothetical protein
VKKLRTFFKGTYLGLMLVFSTRHTGAHRVLLQFLQNDGALDGFFPALV